MYLVREHSFITHFQKAKKSPFKQFVPTSYFENCIHKTDYSTFEYPGRFGKKTEWRYRKGIFQLSFLLYYKIFIKFRTCRPKDDFTEDNYK